MTHLLVTTSTPDRDSAAKIAASAVASKLAATGGAPVAARGRWAEGSPVVLGYGRSTGRWRDNPMRGVGL